jgi:uncharacterized protein YigA (DUF484 family)
MTTHLGNPVQPTPTLSTSEEAIAQYLLETPDFFHRHAQVLAKIQLTHPHTGRAISLADRQIELQRERNKLLELQYQQLLRVGRENVLLAQKLHEWVLGLFSRPSDQALCESLQRIFDVPQAGIDRSEASVRLASTMTEPTCGLAAEAFFLNANIARALPDTSQANSIAVIPMTRVGLLVLASPDVNRFSAAMGTEFLTRLGQLAHAALD